MPVFPYTELKEATNDFHESKELGDGGFGTVYYGEHEFSAILSQTIELSWAKTSLLVPIRLYTFEFPRDIFAGK